jgi:hypothetical protein
VLRETTSRGLCGLVCPSLIIIIALRGTLQYVPFPGGAPPEHWTRPWLISFGNPTESLPAMSPQLVDEPDASDVMNSQWPQGCENSDGHAWALVQLRETVTNTCCWGPCTHDWEPLPPKTSLHTSAQANTCVCTRIGSSSMPHVF